MFDGSFSFSISTHIYGESIDNKIFNSMRPDDPYGSIYTLENWVNIGSGNGLSPLQNWAITWTNDDLLSMELNL